MNLTLSQSLRRSIVLPSSKSLSARALIINALAASPCALSALSDCDDTLALQRALASDASTVDIGAAGTAMRFLTAYYATREGEEHVLTGSERMQQRPIGLLVEALRQLGADIRYLGAEGYPPLHIRGRKLAGGTLSIAADVSSQYISALLMIAPTLSQGLTLHLEGHVASRPYIEMTLRLMEQFGAHPTFDGERTVVPPTAYRRTAPFAIEPDWSAASYWYELVALSPDPDARVVLPGLTAQSLQGDSICCERFRALGVATTFDEVGATLTKCESNSPSPLCYDFADCPDLAQTFVVTAAMLRRPFLFDGLASLRIKETDRLAALKSELLKFGHELAEPTPGQLSSSGAPTLPPAATIAIKTYDDHRMAMAFAPATYLYPQLQIMHPEVVSKSYPNFWHDLLQS